MTERERLIFVEDMKLFKTDFLDKENGKKNDENTTAPPPPNETTDDIFSKRKARSDFKSNTARTNAANPDFSESKMKKKRTTKRISLDDIPDLEKSEYSDYPRWNQTSSTGSFRSKNETGNPGLKMDEEDPLTPGFAKDDSSDRGYRARYFSQVKDETAQTMKTLKENWDNSTFLSVRIWILSFRLDFWR